MKLKDYIKLAEQRHPENRGGFSVKNISKMDTERLLAYLLEHHAEVNDRYLIRKVIEAMAVPGKEKGYKLYDGIQEWVQDIWDTLPEELKELTDVNNVTEQNCLDWLKYLIDRYDFSDDEEFVDGMALLLSTDPDSWVTEDYSL